MVIRVFRVFRVFRVYKESWVFKDKLVTVIRVYKVS